MIVILLHTDRDFDTFTPSQITMMNLHYDFIVKEIPNIFKAFDGYDAPNNEAKCVNFIVHEVRDQVTTNSEGRKITIGSMWTLRERHDDYCGGNPSSGPAITVLDVFEDSKGLYIIFTKRWDPVNVTGRVRRSA